MVDKEIIGYRCPYDLFKGEIKKGTVWKHHGIPGYSVTRTDYYTPHGCSSTRSLPSEIVETWEPVHKEEYKVGDWITVLSDEPGWLAETKERTFQLTYKPERFAGGLMWSTSGPGHIRELGDTGFGVREENIRPATEEEVKKSEGIKVKFGNNEVTIRIGETISVKGDTVSYSTLRALYDNIMCQEERVLGTKWGVHLDKSTRFIRVGCASENNMFSLEEIGYVLRHYEKQNNLKEPYKL